MMACAAMMRHAEGEGLSLRQAGRLTSSAESYIRRSGTGPIWCGVGDTEGASSCAICSSTTTMNVVLVIGKLRSECRAAPFVECGSLCQIGNCRASLRLSSLVTPR